MNVSFTMPRTRRGRIAIASVVAVVTAAVLAGCSLFEDAADEFTEAFNGIPATMSTYNQYGQPIDEIRGTSFRVTRDEQFDTCDSAGACSPDSSVLLISLGKGHISHVGSTMILAEDGLTDITETLPAQFRFSNNKPGTPWINDIHYRFGQLWKGTSRTIMVRSQDGTPIKVYGGNEVRTSTTTVPKSTRIKIDGKTLFIYRADYTIVDNSLLGSQ